MLIVPAVARAFVLNRITRMIDGSIETVVTAMRAGAVDFVVKPASPEKLRSALEAEDPASPEHEVHSAVAFALKEVRRTLAALIEARNEVAG